MALKGVLCFIHSPGAARSPCCSSPGYTQGILGASAQQSRGLLLTSLPFSWDGETTASPHPPISILQERAGEPLLRICKPGPRPGSVKCQHPKSPSSFSKPFGSVCSQNPAALRSAGIFFRNVNQPFQDRLLFSPFTLPWLLTNRVFHSGGSGAWEATGQELHAPEQCWCGQCQHGTGGWVGIGGGNPLDAVACGWFPPVCCHPGPDSLGIIGGHSWMHNLL